MWRVITTTTTVLHVILSPCEMHWSLYKRVYRVTPRVVSWGTQQLADRYRTGVHQDCASDARRIHYIIESSVAVSSTDRFCEDVHNKIVPSN